MTSFSSPDHDLDAVDPYVLRAAQLVVLTTEQQWHLRAQFDPQAAAAWIEEAAPHELPEHLNEKVFKQIVKT